MDIKECEKMSEESLMGYEVMQSFVTEQDISPIARATLKALQDDELMKHTAAILDRITDGEPVNKNPLTEIPAPQMRLYGFSGTFRSAFFDTEEESAEYFRVNNISPDYTCVIEFLGNVAGCSDVIRKISSDGRSILCTAVDEDGYGIYNPERSTYTGEFTWEYTHGNLRGMYSAFRTRGITFENDTYAEIDERYRRLLSKLQTRKIPNRKKDN